MFNEVLQFQRIPVRIIVISALASYIMQIGAIVQGLPLWAIVGLTLIPWIPIFGFEALWKYEHYGSFAIFAVITGLQVGHLAEHSVQVFQLSILEKPFAEARGVFGALDFELIHFVWDTAVWLGSMWLLYIFGKRNVWMWISFIFASFHEVEHIYLYMLTWADLQYYQNGGLTGILGRGGIIGSPWVRPYLHFGYNFMVVLPMVVAFFVQIRRVYSEYLHEALPTLTEDQLVAATRNLQQLKYNLGDTIIRQGDRADRLYILTKGEVEVVREGSGGALFPIARLGPGKFFGEIGILTSARRTATVRALTPVEVLAMEASAFRRLVGESETTEQDLARHLQARIMGLQQIAGRQQVPAALAPRLIRANGEEILVDQDIEIVGRSSENSIRIVDSTVSRRHAIIEREGETYWLEDLGAANGTFVNGQKVDRHALSDGDVVQFGEARLTFRRAPVAAATR
ncbi:MAG: cyclic nucleotide-binding domain-containing protein [Chloroflexi bacterium]|nr:cyclic nucleotide-binding domain-containing protein [Chloroflexota bacterium]